MLNKVLRREGVILLVIAVLAFFYYTNKDTSEFSTLDGYYGQSMSWHSCYDNFECASFEVPVDYNDLGQGSMTIETLRRVADDTAHRIGSLIVNPGGPGASGIDYAYNAEYVFSPDITDRYDIVGFDPRGVGRSTPIVCFNAQETDANYASDSKPDNDAEFAAMLADSKTFVQKCLNKNEHLTAFSTANAARDMDILRELVGDKKLNYMGKSYGTYMGTFYAQFFPDRIGRVVLDGAVDPTISTLESTKSQAISFDNALTSFITDCQKRADCPLAGNVASARDEIVNLFHSAATTPLALKDKSDRRVLSESLMVIGTASALYDSESGWPALRQAITQAKNGYGDAYISLADLYTGRERDGSYPNNEFDAGAVIDCLDSTYPGTIAEAKRAASEIAAAAPVFGPYIAYGGFTCRYLPESRHESPVSTKTKSPLVIIGTTKDPATPYAWSVTLHTFLPNSRLITYVGEGHTGHGRGNACVDDAVDAYFLRGTLPASGLRCTA